MATITKLATLADLKLRLGTTETTQDDQLNALLDDATQDAVDLVGAEIRREADVELYPWDTVVDGAFLYLPRFPIESITSIKQAYSVPEGGDWSGITALTADSDYLVLDPAAGNAKNTGVLQRINSVWVRRPRHIQVVGTFGFADPASVPEGGVAPPRNLQEGIIAQALKRWAFRHPGGLGQKEGDPGDQDGIHDKLVTAAQSLKRWRV